MKRCHGVPKLGKGALLVLGVCITVADLPKPRAAGADDPAATVAAVRASWQRRFERTRNARYAVKGNRLFPKGFLNVFQAELADPGEADARGASGDVPAEDHRSSLESRWSLDFEQNRLRTELKTEIYHEDKKNFEPRWCENVFDGAAVRVHDAAVSAHRADYGPTQWEFAIHKDTEQILEPFDCPVFFAHGLEPVFGTPASRILKRPLHVQQYVFHGRGVVNQRECVIVRSSPVQAAPRIDEYWVDVERDGAISRWRQLENATGAVFVECEVAYAETPHGWYPSRWRAANYWNDGKLVNESAVTVAEFAMNEQLAPDAFTLEPSPGMHLIDDFKGRLYLVAADGSLVAPPPRSAAASRRSSARGWLLLTLAILTIVVVVTALNKRMRARTG